MDILKLKINDIKLKLEKTNQEKSIKRRGSIGSFYSKQKQKHRNPLKTT